MWGRLRDSSAKDRSAAWGWLLLALALVVVLLAGIASYMKPSYTPQTLHSSDQSYTGTELDGAALDFRLIDQHGDTVALSDFREKVVVLAFLDPECQDVCPLTAFHFQAAYAELGDDANAVVFLAVNVNTEVNQVADMGTATEKWGLNEIPTWHYLTGNEETLQPIWQAYRVEVQAANDGEITHTPGVFLIDAAGQLRRYVSTPFQNEAWDGPPLSEILLDQIRQLLSITD